MPPTFTGSKCAASTCAASLPVICSPQLYASHIFNYFFSIDLLSQVAHLSKIIRDYFHTHFGTTFDARLHREMRQKIQVIIELDVELCRTRELTIIIQDGSTASVQPFCWFCISNGRRGMQVQDNSNEILILFD